MRLQGSVDSICGSSYVVRHDITVAMGPCSLSWSGHVMRLPHPVVCVIRVPSERGMCTNDYEFGLNGICGIFMDNGLVC